MHDLNLIAQKLIKYFYTVGLYSLVHKWIMIELLSFQLPNLRGGITHDILCMSALASIEDAYFQVCKRF